MQFRIALLAILTGLSLALNSGLAWSGDVGVQPSEKNRSGDIRPKPSTGDSNRGEKLYQASCNVCHGPRATGGIGPRLAGNPVLSNEKAFWTVVYEGQHVMPPLNGVITSQQMADIRAWLLTLR
ncbi:MAG TPA: cytochrome c [Nitrospira sp.]|nr:cytochrome c [Nitrospira sp.]